MIAEFVGHTLLQRLLLCALIGLVPALLSCETKILQEDEVLVADIVDGTDAIASPDVVLALDAAEQGDAVEDDTDAECPTSAVCPTAGARCVADDLILCSIDSSGCLQAEVTFCGLQGKVCETSGDGAACVDSEQCSSIAQCTVEGVSCQGDTRVACAADSQGCLIEELTDCSSEGLVCINGACVDVSCDAVESQCSSAGTYCDDSMLMECAEDSNGCLSASALKNCADVPGGFCSSLSPARCNGEIVGDFILRRVVDTGSFIESTQASVWAVDTKPVADVDRLYLRTAEEAGSEGSVSADTVLRYVIPTDTLQALVTTDTSIPDGEGTFIDFDPLNIGSMTAHDGVLVFSGNGTSSQRGLYQRDTNGLQRRVDRTNFLPNSTSTFIGISGPILSSGVLAFNGNDFGSNGGVYLSSAVGTPIGALAVKGTLMPGGASGFTGISISHINSEYSIFEGFGPAKPLAPFSGPNRGIYRKSGPTEPLQVIADRHLPVIEYDGESRFELVEGGFAFGEGVIFYGAAAPGAQQPLGFPQHKGIYQWSPDVGFAVVVDTATTIPNASGETFSLEATSSLSADSYAVDGLDVYFRGVGSVDSFISRIGIYRWRDGDIMTVIDTSTVLDGKTITDLQMGRAGAANGRIVFVATFDDGSSGVFVAYSVPQ
jgi:hypothetical protein